MMPLFFQNKPEPDHSPEMDKVRALCAHLGSPFWMRNPRSWVWSRPSDGAPQGFGLAAHDSPGAANLLWLSMEMDRPPHSYSATENGLYTLITVQAGRALLGGEPLIDVAGILTLQQFYDRLPDWPVGSGLEQAYPLLKLLAGRRLRC
jgi:predicted NUDIX family NTP pyrophosphohydrolase